MDGQTLLSDLRAAGLTCRADDGRLIVSPANRIDANLRAIISANKAVLLDHLRQLPADREPGDDRIRCTDCRRFTPPGCTACRNALFSFRSRDHEPDPGRLHRCFLYAPMAEDPDQRLGAARWPDLGWMQRAAPDAPAPGQSGTAARRAGL